MIHKMAQTLALAFLFAGACYAAPGHRIVGGNPTTIANFPSMAQMESLDVLFYTWSQSCACSILNSRFILSAGHCFGGLFYEPSHRRIRVGATYRNIGGILIGVEEDYFHPSYDFLNHDGDIAVARLSDPIVFGPLVQQATIVAQNTVIPDNLPVVNAGWGRTSEGGLPSDQLREVTIFTINNELCRQRYATENQNVTVNMICVGILDVGGKDACQGDSGGPLYYDNIVIGVVSWGLGCADKFLPGVNTAVAPYTDWIVSIAEG